MLKTKLIASLGMLTFTCVQGQAEGTIVVENYQTVIRDSISINAMGTTPDDGRGVWIKTGGVFEGRNIDTTAALSGIYSFSGTVNLTGNNTFHTTQSPVSSNETGIYLYNSKMDQQGGTLMITADQGNALNITSGSIVHVNTAATTAAHKTILTAQNGYGIIVSTSGNNGNQLEANYVSIQSMIGMSVSGVNTVQLNHLDINATNSGLLLTNKAQVRFNQFSITSTAPVGGTSSDYRINAVGLESGAQLTLLNGTIDTLGQNVYGIYAYGKDSKATLENVVLQTKGLSAHALLANSSNTIGTGGLISASKSAFLTKGDGASVAFANYADAQIKLVDSGMETQGKGAHAIYARGYGSVEIDGGSVKTSGAGSYALYANLAGSINVTGATVETSGLNAFGMVLSRASNINLKNTRVTTKSLGAAAIATIAGSYSGVDSILEIREKSQIISENSAGISVISGALDVTMDDSMLGGRTAAYQVAGDASSILSLEINKGSILLGAGVLKDGAIANVSLSDGSTWIIDGESQVSALNVNNSTVKFGATPLTVKPSTDFFQLTVEKDYVADNATLVFNTKLGDDSSQTDFLHVTGNATGTTGVQVVNRGGLGALTTGDGIQLIKVDGTSSADDFSLKSDYSFEGQAAVVGGAYAYSLYAGNKAGDFAGDWYLRSLTIEPPQPPVGPVEPPVIEPKPVYSAVVPMYEVYPQILQQLNKLGTLEQRIGNRTWIGTGSDRQTATINEMEGRGFWMKVEGSTGHINSNVSKTRSNYDLDMIKTQIGLDFEVTESDAGKLIGGA
ncbi:autotransporter outer membrane beta-barrel domain-containing protein, partial [Bartonella sp. LJL80]